MRHPAVLPGKEADVPKGFKSLNQAPVVVETVEWQQMDFHADLLNIKKAVPILQHLL